MRRILPRILLVTALVLVSSTGWAASAEEVVLDLADAGFTITVEAGTELTFEVRHLLLAGKYRFEVEKRGLSPELDLPDFEEAGDGCQQLLSEVFDVEDETDLRTELAQAFSRSPDAECDKRIEAFREQTTKDLGAKVVLDEGQSVTVTIERLRPGSRKWVFEVTTGHRSWLTHYGFSFLPREDEEFFAKASGRGEEQTFTITRVAEPSGSDFEPTVNFTYIPKGARNPWRFTAGLGPDLDEKLVFVGLSWVIGDNVSVFAGAAGHEQTRLKGIYEEGQELAESLTADQLVDETFDANLIVGVGFRFSGNPFAKKDGPDVQIDPSAASPTTTGEAAGATEPGKPVQPGSDPAQKEDSTEPAKTSSAVRGNGGALQ